METELMEDYKIKTTGFEGPFNLLLELIEKRKLFINDLSLASVTEDYLNYVNKLGGFSNLPSSQISSFVLVASTLILIKSKSLLPNLALTDEEQGDIHNLEERLKQYELFTRLSQNIKKDFGKRMIFSPQERKNVLVVFLPDQQITRESMMAFARNTLGSMPKKVFLPAVEVKKVISIEEMIGNLTDRIEKSIKMSFRDFTGVGKVQTREEKITMIVGFLAMLELVRNGILDAVQDIDKGEIMIEKQDSSAINYSPEI